MWRRRFHSIPSKEGNQGQRSKRIALYRTDGKSPLRRDMHCPFLGFVSRPPRLPLLVTDRVLSTSGAWQSLLTAPVLNSPSPTRLLPCKPRPPFAANSHPCLLTWQLAFYVGIFILAKQYGSLQEQMLNPRDLSHSGGAPPPDLRGKHPNLPGHTAGHTSVTYPSAKVQLNLLPITAASSSSLDLGDMLTSDQCAMDPDHQARIP